MPKLTLIASFYWLCLAQKVVSGEKVPSITTSCNPDKTSCTLTCVGDTIKDVSVTYSWKVGEWAWQVGGKQLIVSRSDTSDSNSGNKYICKLKNSAGEEEVSEPVGDLFHSDLYHKVGDEVLLKPDESTVPDPITSILWKHGKNKVADWDKGFGGLEIYGAFKERTTLDQTTGELRITGLKKTDSGVYSVEFNGKLLDITYKLSVIKAVPKPTITSSCNTIKTSCTLTCEGDTTDAEPVTYSWKVGEGLWEVRDKQMTVSKSDTGDSTNGYKYICMLKNSVSREVSEPVGDLFDPEAVPKPTITSSYNTNKTSCTLTCEGDTTDAEPVTYSWKVGDGAWEVIGKQLVVSKSDTGKSTNGYKYICKLKNSVSSEVSEPVGDLFDSGIISEPSEVGGVGVGVIILVLVAIIIAGIWWVWKKKKGYPEDTWIYFLRMFCSRFCGDAGNHQNSVAPDTVYHAVGDIQVANRGSSGVLSGVAVDTVYSTVMEKSPRYYSMNQSNNNQSTNTAKVSDGVQSEQGGNDETKTDVSVGPGGKDETKTDGSVGPGGDINAAEKGEANGEESMLLNEDGVNNHNDNGDGAEEENSDL